VIPAYIRITSMIFCFVILGIGVAGNIMVPIVILKTKDMRNSTNIFLMNLSVADLMVLLVCTPTVLVEVNTKPETWVLGEEMCKIVPFVELTVAHASVLTILAISFERYYAICEPLKASYVCTKARALIICLLAWLFAALFTSPILGVADYHHELDLDGSTVAVCFTQADTFWTAFFFILSIVIFFVVPFVILLVLYTIIARHLMTHTGIIAPPCRYGSYTSGTQHTALRYRKQVVVMLGTVVLSFFLCLMPFRAFTLWIIVAPEEAVFSLDIEEYYNLLYFCRVMTYINSAINPILYNVMSSKFRDGFTRLCGLTSRNRAEVYLGRKGTLNTVSTTTTTNCSSGLQDSIWRR
ncbi:Thyrotropin-releasing hormone receptor, partial [Zootermopsis nevadensis]